MKLLFSFGLLLGCFVVHAIYLSSVVRRQRRNHEERKKAIEPNTTVKQIVRSDGKERIRIVRCAKEAFGAVLERRHSHEWLIEHIAGPGAVFDSAEGAEVQAVRIAPWLKTKSNQALANDHVGHVS